MMRLIAILGLLALTGCAHIASTKATFVRRRDKPLVLTITRHVDTIVHGPDDEEDQLLVLELRDLTIGKRLTIPSDVVKAEFSVQRFAPGSLGDVYRGVIVLKNISEKKVVAALSLTVTASTADHSYKQTAKFRGDYTFTRD